MRLFPRGCILYKFVSIVQLKCVHVSEMEVGILGWEEINCNFSHWDEWKYFSFNSFPLRSRVIRKAWEMASKDRGAVRPGQALGKPTESTDCRLLPRAVSSDPERD